ncbi:MAG: translation initiation factor IF-2 [Holosporales bacterium]|jgi:translation initiation factor IF-2|nr:translation initiation factor IF-2 [Holosporales bacterium]
MINDNDNKIQKRKTLSLRSSIEVAIPKIHAKNKTIEVEIKRKKQGLILDVEEDSEFLKVIDNSSDRTVRSRKLTDKEFETRFRVLQDAMKEEEAVNKPLESIDNEFVEYSNSHVESNGTINTEVTHNEAEAKSLKVTEKIRTKKAESKKKDPVVVDLNPVIFRDSEYKKKSVDALPKQDPLSTQKTEQNSQFAQDVSVQEKFQHKQKNRLLDEDNSSDKLKTATKTKTPDRRIEFGRKVSRVVLGRVMNNDTEERARSIASLKRARQKLKNSLTPQKLAKVIREVDIPDVITVGELANRMAVRSAEVVKYLMSIGTMATVNQAIDGDTAEIVCSEFGHKPRRGSDADIENVLKNIKDEPENLIPRAPVVAIMGHVDHGKTTLLDTLRKTVVAQKEAGGITQHIAAYQLEAENGKKITFIDTPGHAAFSKIRERGAVITDIIVLVVAADDGVKEQTIEVINQANSQNVPIIVAINKIDKPNINIDKLKTELMSYGLILESFGGETLSTEISAKQNINLDKLIETILLQAEMLELKANETRSPIGTILEARVDKGRGIIASIIVQQGTLKNGDIFVAGGVFGKIRTMYDDKGKRIVSVGPSTPIEVIGFDSTPEPGDILSVVDNEQKAREIAEYRRMSLKSRTTELQTKTIEQAMSKRDSLVKPLNIFVKADVRGSVEAIAASLDAIQHPEISIKIVEKAVGIITENDIVFARTTNAIIVGFNVSVSATAKDSAKFNNIKILNHNVIYHIVEEIKSIMGKMLSPIVEENYIGNADVRKIFTISRFGTIAGCYVTDGTMKKSDSKIKVLRGETCVFEGKIRSMRHEKDEIKEAGQSHECGILAEGYNDFKEGDRIECYEIVLKLRSVD